MGCAVSCNTTVAAGGYRAKVYPSRRPILVAMWLRQLLASTDRPRPRRESESVSLAIRPGADTKGKYSAIQNRKNKLQQLAREGCEGFQKSNQNTQANLDASKLRHNPVVQCLDLWASNAELPAWGRSCVRIFFFLALRRFHVHLKRSTTLTSHGTWNGTGRDGTCEYIPAHVEFKSILKDRHDLFRNWRRQACLFLECQCSSATR